MNQKPKTNTDVEHTNVLKGEIPWRNDKGTIKSTWNISLIYSFSERRAHCTSQSKKMHFEKILSGNCQTYIPYQNEEKNSFADTILITVVSAATLPPITLFLQLRYFESELLLCK